MTKYKWNLSLSKYCQEQRFYIGVRRCTLVVFHSIGGETMVRDKVNKSDFLQMNKIFYFIYFIFFAIGYIFFFSLQYCIGLPYINMHLPWMYTCSPSWIPLPPPSPYHPSGSSQCTSPEHPVSCIEPGLEIHFTYDNIHVSMPFSQTIPPSPSLT